MLACLFLLDFSLSRSHFSRGPAGRVSAEKVRGSQRACRNREGDGGQPPAERNTAEPRTHLRGGGGRLPRLTEAAAGIRPRAARRRSGGNAARPAPQLPDEQAEQ